MHDSTATALTHLFKLANFRSRESKSSIDDNSPNNTQQSSLMSSVLKGREEGASASAGATDQESSDKSNELPFGAVGDHFSLSQQFEQAIQVRRLCGITYYPCRKRNKPSPPSPLNVGMHLDRTHPNNGRVQCPRVAH